MCFLCMIMDAYFIDFATGTVIAKLELHEMHPPPPTHSSLIYLMVLSNLQKVTEGFLFGLLPTFLLSFSFQYSSE